MNWKMLRVASIAAMAVLVLAVLLIARPRGHTIGVKTYLTDAMGLRPNAPVRLAGVDVGSVTSVRVRPESKEAPVEIALALKTAYELNIPDDSTVSLETAGVLGETFVEIDNHNASGPPIRSGGTLKAQPIPSLTTEQMIEKFAAAFNLSTSEAVEKLEALIKERCDSGKDQSEAANKRPTTKARHIK
jgi:phospholipid/cholesterol/gamma-HCH transport system substrate-binding protein